MIDHAKILFLIILCCLSKNIQLVSGQVRCTPMEREALLTFKQGLIDEYNVLSSWGSKDEERECCDWYGIECSNATSHVIGLHLTGFNLSGIVSHRLGNLTNLKTLDLSWNYLRVDNLDWLSHLTMLSQLDLSWNKINDVNWLHHLLKLPSLMDLRLIRCFLTDIKVSAYDLLLNSSSMSLSALDLSHDEFTSSAFDWLFNVSKHIVELDISDNQFGGKIPFAFRELIFLENLDLSYNDFEGRIPNFLGNLSRLQSLMLSHNKFTGDVTDLSSCLMLRELSLRSNKLKGSFESFSQLSNLKILDVSFNKLEGTIIESNFLKLSNLKKLDLSYNALTMNVSLDWNPPFQMDALILAFCRIGPYFPTWLQSQRNLSILDLSNAGISDEVPNWLWTSSTTVRYLNLSRNDLFGAIPDLSSKLIRYLDVSYNNLSGPVPRFHPNTTGVQLSQNKFSGSISSLCEKQVYTFLLLFDVSYNQLEGQLPDCWENMNVIKVLNLASNRFAGEIPRFLGSLQNLKALHLERNNLSGELPSTLKSCRDLELIDVARNKLNGTVPKWLGANFMHLKFLIFRGNRFYGAIPREICNLAQIQLLDLSRNSLSGKIPGCFNNYTSLAQKNGSTNNSIYIPFISHGDEPNVIRIADLNFDYALVQWKGQELEYSRTLGLVKLIDLSSNKLVGSIPRELLSLKGLISLNLSRNILTGNIGPNIGHMEMLESLDLSRNRLSGAIPNGFGRLNYLQVLDLSHNNLSGRIPTSTQMQSFNETVYGDNGELCGQPLSLCSEDRPNSSTTTHPGDVDEEKDGLMGFMQKFSTSIAFGFVTGFWGIVGPLLVNKAWRATYFEFFGGIVEWLYLYMRAGRF